jgi:GT2 family glycosyltransferase/peptidoglycan/xylan/chitin deacetylase (PgdA/CDA1 family)
VSERPCHVAILIVGFHNSKDVLNCLCALALATPKPSFDIFICENGGKEAFQELNNVLTTAHGPCNIHSGHQALPRFSAGGKFAEVKCLSLKGRATSVWVARATENLGYAGAINVWLNRLQTIADWDGLWILNPDTEPYPDALANLVDRAITCNKGMISSTIVPEGLSDFVHNRALRWKKVSGSTEAIGFQTSLRAPCDSNAVEAIMDSPSGASMYVTRECVEHIGPMDDRFFLYFEDVDWGIRAKKFGLGYASQSIVPHKGGTTIGKLSASRKIRSELAVYLESRNRILFCKKHFKWYCASVSVASVAYAFLYLFAGSPRNFKIAIEGFLAAWSGEAGPPPDSYDGHLRAIFFNIPTALYRKTKLAISLAHYCGQVVWRAALSILGRPPLPHLTILYYHGVQNSLRFEFARQMNSLAATANVIPADFEGTLPSDKINVSITFDDAFASVVENALPELACHSLHSTIFVPVRVVGREPNWVVDDQSSTFQQVVMTTEQLKALSPTLVAIGSHGLLHTHLSEESKSQAEDEIRRSRKELQDIVEREVNLFAFPYGDYSQHLIGLCKSAGYSHVFTTDAANVQTTSFVRGRIKVEPSDSQIEFFLKIRGAYNWGAIKRKMLRVKR